MLGQTRPAGSKEWSRSHLEAVTGHLRAAPRRVNMHLPHLVEHPGLREVKTDDFLRGEATYRATPSDQQTLECRKERGIFQREAQRRKAGAAGGVEGPSGDVRCRAPVAKQKESSPSSFSFPSMTSFYWSWL